MTRKELLNDCRLVVLIVCSIWMAALFDRMSRGGTVYPSVPSFTRPWHHVDRSYLIFCLFAPSAVFGVMLLLRGHWWQRALAILFLLFPCLIIMLYLLWCLGTVP